MYNCAQAIENIIAFRNRSNQTTSDWPNSLQRIKMEVYRKVPYPKAQKANFPVFSSHSPFLAERM